MDDYQHMRKMRAHGSAPQNKDWWPDRLNLKILAKNPDVINPQDEGFNYKEAFEALDLDAVKEDIKKVLLDSQDWYPSDFGNYGPAAIRMAWHSAGTYRIMDGRGGAGHGQQRFAPLSSWPDNVLLDRIRRIFWPVKKKYGQALSWGDLIALAGNVAHDLMGMPTIGFAGGRVEQWEPDDDVYWGSETEWFAHDDRYQSSDEERKQAADAAKLEAPLAASEMGLIYVNPQGPKGNPDPLLAARDIKETFHRMGMDDEEIVALIAGGHTFGKTHGAGPKEHVGPAPEGAPLEQMGLGWKSTYGEGKGNDTIGDGTEVTWTYHPTRWDNEFFHILFAYDWELMQSPAGAFQWHPKDGAGSDMVPMAQGPGKREPRMLTTDLALRFDPDFEKISRAFAQDQQKFTDAYARAWFKLIHRGLGPKSRWLGKDVPEEDFLWHDPLPKRDYELIDDADVAVLEGAIAEAGFTASELVGVAFAAESIYRESDMRGGANGGRIRLAPQRDWEVNRPDVLARVIEALEGIAADFNGKAEGGKKVSFADLVVLAGNVGVKKAFEAAGRSVEIPFTPGRVDATEEQTDFVDFEFLEPAADGFRSYQDPERSRGIPAERLLIDRANLLTLSVPELTVLMGGLKSININWDGSDTGVLTSTPGALTTEWFVNLLDMKYEWKADDEPATHYTAYLRETGEKVFTATRADLVFGANSELRAVAEVYAEDGAEDKFVRDFVDVWVKLGNLDRFDVTWR